MSLTGYDIEDAVILNRASVDRGFARCVVYRKFTVTRKRYKDNTQDRIKGVTKEEAETRDYEALSSYDGIAEPGVKLRNRVSQGSRL